MDNSETLATLGTQDTGRKKHTRKIKKYEQREPHQKLGVKPG